MFIIAPVIVETVSVFTPYSEELENCTLPKKSDACKVEWQMKNISQVIARRSNNKKKASRKQILEEKWLYGYFLWQTKILHWRWPEHG